MPESLAVTLPASKSVSNRALLLNALSGGAGRIANAAECADTEAMRRGLADGGASLVDVGAAGSAMRFLTAYMAARPGRRVVLDGSPRMRRRPIGALVDALRQCGASVRYVGEEGYPPMEINGRRLSAGRPVEIDGSVSSQFVSALMMVGPTVAGGLTLSVKGRLVSRPYVEMTAAIMRRFGVEVVIGEDFIRIPEAVYRPASLTVESDWSAASYWYEIKALLPDLPVVLRGLRPDSVQGDRKVADYFRDCFGVGTRFLPDGAELVPEAERPAGTLRLDLSGEPDLAQTIAVTACMAGRAFRIGGLSTLRLKETDRVEALRSQLSKLGCRIEVDGRGDEIAWDGRRTDVGRAVRIDTFDDHRMAMAFAPAAAVCQGITICDARVVAKSYPDYWKHLAAAGFVCEEERP